MVKVTDVFEASDERFMVLQELKTVNAKTIKDDSYGSLFLPHNKK